MVCVGAGSGMAQQKIQDFYLSNYKDDGGQDWEVKGQEAIVSEEYVDIENMEGKYYQGQDTVDIKADRARLAKEYMDVYLDKNVTVESSQGVNLTTDSLQWKQSTNQVSTDTRVEVQRQNSMKVAAEGMEADTELKTVKFKEEVTVDISQEDDSTTITCDGPLEIDHPNGRAVFYNNVEVDNPQGKLIASKVTVYFDNQQNAIIKIVAEGDVKIIRDDNVTFADQAVYMEESQKMILEGRPRLIIFPEASTGLFNAKGKQ
jgi:LPS export ABC transporter protein LptC